MTAEEESSSQHLAAARELLDELRDATQGPDAQPQTMAIAAAAHSILVLAEQVAVIRVLLTNQAVQAQAQQSG